MPSITDPLHLTSLVVPKPWGGRRLERLGRALPAEVMVGEIWEVADLASADASGVERPSTPVATGPFEGRTLGELLAGDRDGLLGQAADWDGRFPLLFKLLDVREPLSVQVHPPEGYVARHPEATLKTETWVVLDADPGAEVMIGLADGATVEQVSGAMGSPDLVQLLHRAPAEVGAVHHLPAGTIHAVGGGVLLAEIQTPSDTTFRLYDWVAETGRAPRQLHLEEGREALELAAASAPRAHAAGCRARDSSDRLPLDAGHYRLDRCHLGVGEEREIPGGTLRVVHVVTGELEGDGFAWPVAAGSTVVLPAAWHGTLRAGIATTWLETTLPERADAGC